MKITGRNHALVAYSAAMAAIALGVVVAIARFPGGFDWSYSVISKLASLNHNPQGGAWICGGLGIGMILLWPVANRLAGSEQVDRPRFALSALRVGLIGGILLALEGLFMVDLSVIARKAHELLALTTLLGLYVGVLGLYVHRLRRGLTGIGPALVVLLPLLAVGTSQLALYFGQRDLGWVDTSWREMGVPVWWSFAFWQWTAVAVLGGALGHLTATSDSSDPSEPSSSTPITLAGAGRRQGSRS